MFGLHKPNPKPKPDGRYHYHNRPRLRGVKHVIFYALPHFKEFYAEILGSVMPDDESTVTVLYTK